MNLLENLNAAIAYLEEHLGDPLDWEALARKAGCSSFQLQRMFPYLTGMTLPEYVRRRRMTRAAVDLLAGAATSRPPRSIGRSRPCTGWPPARRATGEPSWRLTRASRSPCP